MNLAGSGEGFQSVKYKSRLSANKVISAPFASWLEKGAPL